jgi:16S rRNA (adenine1518-N6/adenine1519-N6)-dimethyltransferase
MTKAEIDALLESLGLTGLIRAEAMNVEEFLGLAMKLRERLEPEPEHDANASRKDEI